MLTLLSLLAACCFPGPGRNADGDLPKPAGPPPLASGVRLSFVPGSTRKVEQLIGDKDRETGEPTLSQTQTRYGILGTDLGYPVEHDGRVCFLFGDTIGVRSGDTIACTDAKDGDGGVKLDFLTDEDGKYLRVLPAGVSMGGFEVPVAGIDLGKRIYVVVRTKEEGSSEGVSVLTKFDEPASTFTQVRELSRLPDGHFLQGSMRRQPERIRGLPEGGPWILMWGTGAYRQSKAYLSIVPARAIESGDGTRYFAGVGENGAPRWSERESDAVPIVHEPEIGDMNVTWIEELDVWLMVYDQRNPFGVVVRYAPTPWGPWSPGEKMFDRNEGMGRFIHEPNKDDGLSGPVIGIGDKKIDPMSVGGGAYAPYVVERFTRVNGDKLDLYYVLSTWNPYVVVLMNSELKITR